MTDVPFGEWIGRRSESEDLVTERLAAGFRAVFVPHLAAVESDEAPLGLHWCLSPPAAPMAALGADGHPALSRDMPPVPQPRRMWAGGAVAFLAPLRLGDRVRRVSTVAGIARKDGRSGELWFVTMEHEHIGPRGPAIRERQDIVYREAANLKAPAAAPPEAPRRAAVRSWTVETPPALLFRYSALTFNTHRIHYDLPYATLAELYDGLVVHGPLQATLLINLAAVSLGAAPGRFEYRGVAPAIGGRPLAVRAGADGRLWTEGPDGRTPMEARAERA